MGYKIIYGPCPEERKSTGERESRLRIMTAAFLLVFCLLAGTLWPEGGVLLRKVLLPGEPTVAETAFQNLILDLRTGEPASEAITVFCAAVVSDEIQDRR